MSMAAAFGCYINVGSQFDNHGCSVNLMDDAVNGIGAVDEVLQVKVSTGSIWGMTSKSMPRAFFLKFSGRINITGTFFPLAKTRCGLIM